MMITLLHRRQRMKNMVGVLMFHFFWEISYIFLYDNKNMINQTPRRFTFILVVSFSLEVAFSMVVMEVVNAISDCVELSIQVIMIIGKMMWMIVITSYTLMLGKNIYF